MPWAQFLNLSEPVLSSRTVVTPTSPELRAERCNPRNSAQHAAVNIIPRGGSQILTQLLNTQIRLPVNVT